MMISYEQAARAFAAAGSEPRLQVLNILVRAGEAGLTVGEIQKKLEIPASTMAHHLKFMAVAGLITQIKQGREVINRADFDHIELLAAFLLHECCVDAAMTGD